MKDPQRADAPGTTRTPASAQPRFSGMRSANSNGPISIVSSSDSRKSRRMACFSQMWTTTSPVVGVDLGHPGLAAVEQGDRLPDHGQGVVVGGGQFGAALPELFDLGL